MLQSAARLCDHRLPKFTDFYCTLTSPLSHQSCVVIDLYGTSFRSASLLSSILSLGEAESCWPPGEGFTNTDQLPVFAVIGSCLPLS